MISEKGENNNISKDRIQAQLDELQMIQPPLAYRVSKRSNRTILHIKINALKSTILKINSRQQSKSIYYQEDYEDQDQYVEDSLPSKYDQEQPPSKETFNKSTKQQEKQSIMIRKNIKDTFQDQDVITFLQEQTHSESIIFAIILYYDFYPFEAPFVTICKANMFPGSSQFKDYYYSIMEMENWWPLITLKQIILKLPHFAYNLLKLYHQDKSLDSIGGYSYDFPLYKQDIKEYAQRLIISNCTIKYNKYKYSQRKLGLTSAYLLIFNNKGDQALVIQKQFSIKLIAIIQQKTLKKHRQIAITLKNSERISISFKHGQYVQKDIIPIKIFLKYYQIANYLTAVTNREQKCILIEQLQSFIDLADSINNKQAIIWAKNHLQSLMHNISSIH